MARLTKKQALELLPAVADHEATEDEKLAFLSYIEKHDDVRKQYESALRVKELLRTRYPKATAPKRFREEINSALSSLKPEESTPYRELKDSPCGKSVHGSPAGNTSFFTNSLFRYFSAAVVILIIIFLVVDLLDRTSSFFPGEPFIVEQYAAEHFLNSKATFIEPRFATSSTYEAEQYITDQYKLNVMIPDLTGAKFTGVMMADFYDGLEVPLLEYEQPEANEMIYIFAFNVDDLETNRFLQRNEQAVNTCKLQNDFHVLEVGNHHVVSWLWHDKWYTAISNFNGYDLASLVEPLEYTP